jgi:hypothetical protein
MAELIPSISITEFRAIIKDISKLKRLKCCEVTSDGDYLFTFVNPATPFIRKQVEYKAQLSNAVGGETLEDILKKETVKV